MRCIWCYTSGLPWGIFGVTRQVYYEVYLALHVRFTMRCIWCYTSGLLRMYTILPKSILTGQVFSGSWHLNKLHKHPTLWISICVLMLWWNGVSLPLNVVCSQGQDEETMRKLSLLLSYTFSLCDNYSCNQGNYLFYIESSTLQDRHCSWFTWLLFPLEYEGLVRELCLVSYAWWVMPSVRS